MPDKMKHASRLSVLLALASSAPVFAEAPPAIPSGPVMYTSVSPAASDYVPSAPAPAASPLGPMTPSTYRSRNLATLTVNAYSSNYQVRGMGVTNAFSDYGWSSADLTLRPGSSNLFGYGLGQEIDLGLGAIYGASDALGEASVWHAGYGLTRELLPNLTAKVGYSLMYGGLEGFLAKARGKAPHRVTENLNVSLVFNDHQQGFFGSFLFGVGFQGLTGSFGDLAAGYRWCDPLPARGNWGLDVALSAGQSFSLGYWAGGAEGFDATRLRLDLLPYTANGTVGRDARLKLVPWVQTSWSGNNAKKIERSVEGNVVDHFQFTVGVDVVYAF